MVADFGHGPAPLSIPASSPTKTTGTASYPRADIAGDTRLVLAAPASDLLLVQPQLRVPTNGTVHQIQRVEGPLAGSARLGLWPRVQLGSEWRNLPTRLVNVEDHEGRRQVGIDLELPEGMAGRTVQLEVMATAIDWGPRVSVRSAPLQVPQQARLDLATGILEQAWASGPVDFVVEACADSACTALYETRMDPARESDRVWRDASIDLEAYAGATVSLVFRSTLSPVSSEQLSLPVWANPTIRIPHKADRSAPNVVLLSIDTLSARHLPTYGYFRDTAPTIAERFERGGTVFDNCVAAATSTPESHMSMLTGLQPLEHGIGSGPEVLNPAIATIAEQVRAAGITTSAISEDGWLAAATGFGRGFDEYKEAKSADVAEPGEPANPTFTAAKSWLRGHADQRFFLFLHTLQVHDPYVPPVTYANLFSTKQEGEAIGADAPAHIREAQGYDQEIRYTDDEVAALLATMDELRLSDTTVFIVVSDHGEAFLEHGFLRHGSFLFEEVTHVPLMMRGPGVPPGLRVAAPVGHVDLADTIASFLGVEPPPGSRGVDLRRTFSDGGSAVDGAFYFSESWGGIAAGPQGTPMTFRAPAFAVRQGQRKTVRYRSERGAPSSECYDLAKDPGEETNLCAGTTPEPADLAAMLEAYQQVAARHRTQLLGAGDATTNVPSQLPLDSAREGTR